MNFEDFHFIRPYWLFAILPLLVMLWLLLRRQLSSGDWANVCDPQLLPHILVGEQGQRRAWPIYILGIAALLAIFALAGPAWERLPQPVFRDESALVIVLDLSRSMDATDIMPSRLARARFKIADILKRRQQGQTALLVYAGDVFTVTPLTDDSKTIISQLSVLNTSLMPSQGSRVDIALEKAAALLHQAGFKKGHILLITDGVNAVKKLKQYQLSVLGVGTQQGAPIPLASGGFQKDNKGAIVISKLDDVFLRELAHKNGGIYQAISLNDSDINTLLSAFTENINQSDKQDFQIDTWREEGPWLLLFVLPLAAFAFRRGYLAIILVLIIPQPAPAWDWRNLWLTPDQQASQAFEKGDMPKAAELFNNQAWKAAAHYKAGDYKKALKSLEGLSGAENLYNRGNALARLGRYPEAVEAYKKALELNPEHEDAKYNKKLIEDLQKQQEQESQNQEGQNSQGQESQNQEEQNSQEQEAKKESLSQQNAEQQQESQEEAQQYSEQTTLDETQQANEQWLRKLPDDPGGLLRRKFQYQYQQRNKQQSGEEQPW